MPERPGCGRSSEDAQVAIAFWRRIGILDPRTGFSCVAKNGLLVQRLALLSALLLDGCATKKTVLMPEAVGVGTTR